VRTLLADLGRGALDLLWPRACLACGATLGGTRERWLCRLCRYASGGADGPESLCAVCAARLGPATAAGGCRDCRAVRPGFEAVRSAGAYAGPLRRLVVGLKYARRTACVWPLGDLLARRLRGWGPLPRDALLVSFPTTAEARRRRGFDPPALLAAELARNLDLPLAEGVLSRSGSPPPQASLPRTERLRTPRGTVVAALAGPVRDRTVLLVDDVLTTGASASEAARVLRAAGAARILVAVAARA